MRLQRVRATQAMETFRDFISNFHLQKTDADGSPLNADADDALRATSAGSDTPYYLGSAWHLGDLSLMGAVQPPSQPPPPLQF